MTFQNLIGTIFLQMVSGISYLFSSDLLAIDLIKKLLTKDPMTRLTADQVLTHPWFKRTSMDDIKKRLIARRLLKVCVIPQTRTDSIRMEFSSMEAILAKEKSKKSRFEDLRSFIKAH
jgi:serine/threonine protein kinase